MRMKSPGASASRCGSSASIPHILTKGVDDEDVMFARPGPAVEYWEGED
jgi:hypothetical protein